MLNNQKNIVDLLNIIGYEKLSNNSYKKDEFKIEFNSYGITIYNKNTYSDNTISYDNIYLWLNHKYKHILRKHKIKNLFNEKIL